MLDQGTPRLIPIQAAIRDRLLQSSFLLMSSFVISNGLGLVFWAYVGRYFDADSAGFLAAILSGASIVAILSSLGLSTSLIRYLPNPAKNGNDLVNYATTMNLIASFMFGALLSLVLFFIGSSYDSFSLSPFILACIVVVAIGTSLNVISDSIFVGKFVAKLIPIRNTVIGIARVVLLLGLFLMGFIGLILAYTVSVILSIGLTFFVLFPSAIRGYTNRISFSAGKDNVDFSHYSRSSYPADVLSSVSYVYFPFLVAGISGLPEAAFFYIAWSVGSLSFLLPSSLTTSFFAESSNRTELVDSLERRTMAYGLLGIAVVFLAFIVIGESILGLFGSLKSDESLGVLLLISASACPMLLLKVKITRLRLQSRLKEVTFINGVVFITALTSAVILGLTGGIVGVAIGWIIGQISGLAFAAHIVGKAN